MSHPVGLPNLFVDRSLGRLRVPTLLREAGLRLTTLAERYGVPADESITDVQWLTEAGRRREAVFLKDARVRYNPAEKAAIVRSRVRAFCLARQDLPADLMAQQFLQHLGPIEAARVSHDSGLFVVTSGGLRQVPLVE